MSLEAMMEKVIVSQEKLVASHEKYESRFQEIEKQVSQLAQMVGRLKSRGKLPSQTENNPRANVSAITLLSGTIIEPKAQEKEAAESSRLKKQNLAERSCTEATLIKRPRRQKKDYLPRFSASAEMRNLKGIAI
ncbi:hypothetical protein V6N13_053405 [Hibiscus sabdariffa]